MHCNCSWKTPRQFCSQIYKVSGPVEKKKAPGRSEHSRRYTDTLSGAPGPPATSKGSTRACTEERGTCWTLLGDLPRDGHRETMSLQHVLHQPKCMPYTSQLRLQQGASIHVESADQTTSPPFPSATVLLPQQERWKVFVPSNTASVMARSARQQIWV